MTLQNKKQYSETYEILEMCNDCYRGSPYAQSHLVKFLREDDDTFVQRSKQAVYDNFVKRTVQGITNIIFRKLLFFESTLNSEQQKIIDSIDLKNSLDEFAKSVTKRMIRDGFTFILVDSPKVSEAASRYDEIANNIRPYLVSLERAAVTNWKEKEDGTFKFLQFEEVIDTYNDNLVEDQTKITKLFTDDGLVRIYKEATLIETIDTGLNFVPAVKLGEDLIPMIYDQCKINVSHMNRSSELDNYLRVAAAPIPVSYMMDSDDSGVKTIGVNQGISFSSPKGEAGFEWVSLEAKNTEALRQRLTDLETSMLNIAVTFATSSKIKTATQVEKESTEDESKLSDIAQRLEEGLNKALDYLSQYKEGFMLPYVTVNKDFDSNRMSPERLDRYLQLYREGIMSLETFWKVLEQGEVIEIEDKEREKQLLLDSGEL